MPQFRSAAASLVVYKDGAKVARFVGNEFATDDKEIAAYLRTLEGVEEVKEPKKQALPATEETPPAGSGREGAAPVLELETSETQDVASPPAKSAPAKKGKP